MKNKKTLVAILIIACTFTIGGLFVKKQIVKANDEILKKDIVKFNHMPLDKIKSGQDLTIGNQKIHELYDDNYFYHVSNDGTLYGIVSRNTIPKIGVKLSANDKDLLKSKAYDILKKFGKEKYVLNAVTNDLDINGIYTLDFVEKNTKGICTGNYISVSLSSDGQLEYVSFNAEDSSIADKSIKITENQAVSIAFQAVNDDKTMKYLIKTNKLSKGKDILSISVNQYIAQRTTYKGKAAWSITIKGDATADLFTYVIDANTGELIFNPKIKSDVQIVTNPNTVKK